MQIHIESVHFRISSLSCIGHQCLDGSLLTRGGERTEDHGIWDWNPKSVLQDLRAWRISVLMTSLRLAQLPSTFLILPRFQLERTFTYVHFSTIMPVVLISNLDLAKSELLLALSNTSETAPNKFETRVDAWGGCLLIDGKHDSVISNSWGRVCAVGNDWTCGVRGSIQRMCLLMRSLCSSHPWKQDFRRTLLQTK